MPDVYDPSVCRLWENYLQTLGETPETTAHTFTAWHFCDNQADADELADLTRRGIKRATAPALWQLEAIGEPVAEPGTLSIITDWTGTAHCVIRTTQIDVVPFDEVTAEFAAAEGEGDGSLTYWRRVHETYYRRVLAGTAHAFRPDMPVVCERFEVVFT